MLHLLFVTYNLPIRSDYIKGFFFKPKISYERLNCPMNCQFFPNGFVNKQNCRMWIEINPQQTQQSSLHLEKGIVWCGLKVADIISSKMKPELVLPPMEIVIAQ